MTHRRLLLIGLVVCVLALTIGTYLVWPRSEITRENAARIKSGMTLEEVEEILGGPGRDETNGVGKTIAIDLEPTNEPRKKVAVAVHRWIGEDRVIHVSVDAEGRVINLWSGYPASTDSSLLNKLCRWLRP